MTKSLGTDMFHFGTSHNRRVIIISGGERTKCLYNTSGLFGRALLSMRVIDVCREVEVVAALVALGDWWWCVAANPLRPMKYNRRKTVAYRNV